MYFVTFHSELIGNRIHASLFRHSLHLGISLIIIQVEWRMVCMLYWFSQLRICMYHTELYNIRNIRMVFQFHCILELDVLIFLHEFLQRQFNLLLTDI